MKIKNEEEALPKFSAKKIFDKIVLILIPQMAILYALK